MKGTTMRRTIRAAVIAAAVVLIGLVVAPVAAQNQCPDGWSDVWASGGFGDGRTATIDGADLLEVWNWYASESDGRILANGIDIGAAPVANDATVVLPLPEGDGQWLITAEGRVSVCVRGITTTTTTTTLGSTTTIDPTTTTTSTTITTPPPPPDTSSTVPTTTAEPSTSEPPTTSVPPSTTTDGGSGNYIPVCDGYDVAVWSVVSSWEFAVYDTDGTLVTYREGDHDGTVLIPVPGPGEYRAVLVVDDVTMQDAVVTIEGCDEPPTTVAPPPETLPETGISLGMLGGVALLLLGIGVALEGLTRKGVER